MSELTEQLDKLHKSMKKASKKLVSLSESMRRPAPPLVQSPGYMAYQGSPTALPMQYPSEPAPFSESVPSPLEPEDLNAVPEEDYRKLAKKLKERNKTVKELKTILQEYVQKSQEQDEAAKQQTELYGQLERDGKTKLAAAEGEISRLKLRETELTKALEDRDATIAAQTGTIQALRGKVKERKKALKSSEQLLQDAKQELQLSRVYPSRKVSADKELSSTIVEPIGKALLEENAKLKEEGQTKSRAIEKFGKTMVSHSG